MSESELTEWCRRNAGDIREALIARSRLFANIADGHAADGRIESTRLCEGHASHFAALHDEFVALFG